MTLAPPQEYAAAMADVERRALAGELTLVQVRQEIFALRERFDVVEAIGTMLTPRMRDALEAEGFVRIEQTPSGFRARR